MEVSTAEEMLFGVVLHAVTIRAGGWYGGVKEVMEGVKGFAVARSQLR